MAYLQKIQTQESIQDNERIHASQAEAYDFSKAFVWIADRTCNRWNHSGHSQSKQGEDTEDKEGKREGMVGKKAGGGRCYKSDKTFLSCPLAVRHI